MDDYSCKPCLQMKPYSNFDLLFHFIKYATAFGWGYMALISFPNERLRVLPSAVF